MSYVKFFATLLSIQMLSFEGKAQKNNIQGAVTYTYIMKNMGVKADYSLLFTEFGGLYNLYQEDKTFKTSEGYEFYLHKRHLQWYLNFKTREVIHQERVGDKDVFAVYAADPIDWEIQEETGTILGYKVQKAIAKKHHFLTAKSTFPYGDAVAWFAVDIPVPMGPERFWGLPGLILQIKFTNFVGEYTATHIHFQKVDIAIPNTGVKVTKEQILERNKIDKKWLKKASDLLNNDN